MEEEEKPRSSGLHDREVDQQRTEVSNRLEVHEDDRGAPGPSRLRREPDGQSKEAAEDHVWTLQEIELLRVTGEISWASGLRAKEAPMEEEIVDYHLQSRDEESSRQTKREGKVTRPRELHDSLQIL